MTLTVPPDPALRVNVPNDSVAPTPGPGWTLIVELPAFSVTAPRVCVLAAALPLYCRVPPARFKAPGARLGVAVAVSSSTRVPPRCRVTVLAGLPFAPVNAPVPLTVSVPPPTLVPPVAASVPARVTLPPAKARLLMPTIVPLMVTATLAWMELVPPFKLTTPLRAIGLAPPKTAKPPLSETFWMIAGTPLARATVPLAMPNAPPPSGLAEPTMNVVTGVLLAPTTLKPPPMKLELFVTVTELRPPMPRVRTPESPTVPLRVTALFALRVEPAITVTLPFKVNGLATTATVPFITMLLARVDPAPPNGAMAPPEPTIEPVEKAELLLTMSVPLLR